MKRYSPSHIRNVVLVGHSSAGKTTLAEALLHRAGVTTRMGRVDQGTTVCDYDPEEQRRGLSLSLAMAPFEWKDHKINLIDTPGYADFVGDVIAALRVCDLAVFVLSAVEGVQVQTEAVWKIANKMGVPRMVFVNKIDLERADFQSTLAQLQSRFGAGIAPLELRPGRSTDFWVAIVTGADELEFAANADAALRDIQSHRRAPEPMVERGQAVQLRYSEIRPNSLGGSGSRLCKGHCMK